MCVAGDGSIASVDKIRSTGSVAYDRRIERTIKETWSFEPLDGGDAACTGVTFIYSQR